LQQSHPDILVISKSSAYEIVTSAIAQPTACILTGYDEQHTVA
jgi:hypothetical protein